MDKKHHFCSNTVESEKIADKGKVRDRSLIFYLDLKQGSEDLS